MDMLTLALEGRRKFCFVIREDAEGKYYLRLDKLPGGEPTEFEVGFVYDKFGVVIDAGETSYIDQWMIENRPENGHCFKQDLCEEHKVPVLSPTAKLLAEYKRKGVLR